MLSMNQGPGGSKTSTPAGSLNAVAPESTTRSHRLPSPDRPAAVTPPTALTRDEDIRLVKRHVVLVKLQKFFRPWEAIFSQAIDWQQKAQISLQDCQPGFSPALIQSRATIQRFNIRTPQLHFHGLGPLSRSSLGIGSGNSSDDSRHLSENYARATSESSGAASDEDRIAYRNKRQFPPLFPTHLGNNSSSRRGRSIQTNRIAAWFTQHEKFHSPVRQPNPPEDSTEESPHGASQSSSDLSQSEVELLWRQLKEKRAQVEEIRGKMSRMRVELRGMRRLRDEAENSFMTAIRPLVVLGTVPPAALALVDSQMDEMRKSREAYHFVESRYEDSERDLDTREEDLDNLEIRFFSLLSMVPSTSEGHASAPVQGGQLDRTTALAEDMPYELLGIVGEKALEDVHPLYDALSSRVGDLSNAEEEYQDLMHARDECEEERSLGEKTGQAVSSHAKRFLAEFPSEERKLRASVARIEEEVNKLKRLCQQKGVMKKHMAIKMAWKLDRTIAYDDMELQSTTEILRNHSSLTQARAPTLLSCPNHLLESPEPLTARQYLRAATRLPDSNTKKTVRKQLAAKELEIEMLSLEPEPGSSGISINKWLLHQLRTSRIQVMLHRWVSEPICGPTVQVDTLQWEHEVLFFWFRDKIRGTELKFSPSTANETERSYLRGTPQLSKAASEGRSAAKRHLWIKVKGSEVRSVT
ncbi:hypothetical protein AAL_08207 [Moelleriella libera RCEF 2490]|uniref:Uncharacterized protein n=1 Tax=Moelleriella libera RCEF 2490 TaxID=1081109 RepID=A0A162IES1_9HYPO|nr:hypothetical protein AAL_08207 [Moelleriella libera RCEF 2490]